MKILIYNITIFSKKSKGKYDATRSSKICQQNYIKQILQQNGHHVDYKQSYEQNVNFAQYDKIILSPMSPFSLYAKQQHIKLMYDLFHNFNDKIYIQKSDSTLKNDLLAGMRQNDALIKTLSNNFNGNKLKYCEIIGGPEKCLEIIKHDRPILISTMMPSKLNQSLKRIGKLPNKFVGYNMNGAIPDLSPLYLPISKKIKRWCSADMNKSTTQLLITKKKEWPQLLYGNKTEIKTQAEIVKEYRNSVGVLSFGALSFCAFQRLRFQTAAYCGSIIACDRAYGKSLGQPYQYTIDKIQQMTDSQLQQIANAQRDLLFSEFQTKQKVYQILCDFLEI